MFTSGGLWSAQDALNRNQTSGDGVSLLACDLHGEYSRYLRTPLKYPFVGNPHWPNLAAVEEDKPAHKPFPLFVAGTLSFHASTKDRTASENSVLTASDERLSEERDFAHLFDVIHLII